VLKSEIVNSLKFLRKKHDLQALSSFGAVLSASLLHSGNSHKVGNSYDYLTYSFIAIGDIEVGEAWRRCPRP
jgi:hypothetical protein